jgi:peptidoglycan/xylan/chitin deacetylase (PgdA/CDA1 family)
VSHRIHILTYHSQNIGVPTPEHNDHECLRADLVALHRAGWRVLPLDRAVRALETAGDVELPERCVCLTFDDGCDMDYRDINFPGAGPQRGFLGILQDFVANHGADAQPELHATCFVIANPDARRTIDRGSLYGRGWISEDWWRPAQESGLLAIENHGWDHFHPDVRASETVEPELDSLEECERQVVQAADYIAGRTGRRPRYFAYPFGEVRPFLRDRFLRADAPQHGCAAAFGTRSAPLTADCDRWDLPRHVCGRDWRAPEELLGLLDA